MHKVDKFLVVRQYSYTQKCFFYLSDKDNMIQWVSKQWESKKFNTVEGAMIFIENEKHIDIGEYEVVTIIKKH